MNDLDHMFGTTIDAQPRSGGTAKDKWEEEHSPTSLTILSDSSAQQLKRFMEDVEEGFSAGKVLADDTIIIWVVDGAGDVRFAVEEMVHGGLPTGLPKLQTFPLTRRLPKLGHPSLLGEDTSFRGRIAGEIRLENLTGSPYWSINRRSGRYGYFQDRIYLHLKNAADRFRAYGIELKIDADF